MKQFIIDSTYVFSAIWPIAPQVTALRQTTLVIYDKSCQPFNTFWSIDINGSMHVLILVEDPQVGLGHTLLNKLSKLVDTDK